MTAEGKALRIIKTFIPEEVLQLALYDNYIENRITSIDDKIRDAIIRGLVIPELLPDTSKTAYITNDDLEIVYNDELSMVVKIDPSKINNKYILAVESLYRLDTSYGGYGNERNELVSKITDNIIAQNALYINSEIEILGKNLFYIKHNGYLIGNFVLKILVTNDASFEDLSPRQLERFGEISLMYAKVYIRNKLLVKIDEGYIYNGKELSIIKETIDSFEISLEEINEKKKEFRIEAKSVNDRFMDDMIKGYFGQ